MGSMAGSYYGFWEANPRRWERCLEEAGKVMEAEGWSRHAGKFHAVRLKRARKLWAKGE